MLTGTQAPVRHSAVAGTGAIILAAILTGCGLLTQPGAAQSDSEPDTPYITAVYEFVYGPGQHAGNEQLRDGDQRSADSFIGSSSGHVLLGGWGGYIVAGFGSDIPNIPDQYDFAVFTQPGTHDEPAVVYVMADHNGSGNPDGTWYALRGSESDQAGYDADYRVTYHRPPDEHSNIAWSDNRGNSGELLPGYPEGATSADWWWSGYGDAREITLSGVLLPPNMYAGDGIWKASVKTHTWGYAENYEAADLYAVPFGERTRSANAFDIGNAVDAAGSPVELEHIRFIKLQTGVFQIAGWLNEVSSEVSGAVNLHAPAIAEAITWQ